MTVLPRADIGLFDSGLGGLSVLREIRRQMPRASVLYLADTLNVPYGDKPVPVVRDLALRLTARLAEAHVSLVLMASGTSTVAGLSEAQECFPALPILGTITPGARAAVAARPGPVGVLATNATARSLAFTHAIQALDSERVVVEVGCPAFVPLVESGRAETGEAEAAACEYLRSLHRARVQTVVLGCTHFPFLLPVLHRAVRRLNDPAFRPAFVDPSEEVVREAVPLLPPTDGPPHPPTVFAATGDPVEFSRFASLLLGEPLPPVLPLRL